MSGQMGELGSGAGKGGGSGGSIRDAGGGFGKREQAAEARYFWELNEQLIKDLKKKERKRQQATKSMAKKGNNNESDHKPPSVDDGSGSDVTTTEIAHEDDQ